MLNLPWFYHHGINNPLKIDIDYIEDLPPEKLDLQTVLNIYDYKGCCS